MWKMRDMWPGKFEYAVVDNSHLEKAKPMLDLMGANGWEAVKIEYKSEGSSRYYSILLKRKLRHRRLADMERQATDRVESLLKFRKKVRILLAEKGTNLDAACTEDQLLEALAKLLDFK
ncbi:MAG: hypothetical protein NVS9B4_00620 [Candidatus Acidiferrum sp.]